MACRTRCKCSFETSRNKVKVNVGNKVQISNREKGRYLTQSYDECPYTSRKC